MNFEDIVFDIFESDDVVIETLYEGFLPITPALAYLTFKRNMLGKLHKAGKNVDAAVDDAARGVKSKGLIAREKARASVGKTSGKGDDATVYKLTKQQKEVLSQVYEKYGDEIIDDIMTFRKEILAPYQLIKRMVKDNKIVTAKDKFGMTHAQYKAAVESGKKKIEKRGSYFGDTKGKQLKIEELSNSIDNLRDLLTDFKKTGQLKESIVNKVLKNYNLAGSDFENISLEDLKKTYDELRKNSKIIKTLRSKDLTEPETQQQAQDIVKRNIEVRKGIISKESQAAKEKEKVNEEERYDVDQTSINSFPEFKKNGKFNAAFAKYMLRRSIINQLKVGSNPRLKKMYESMIKEMIDEARDRHSRLIKSKAKDSGRVEFNDIESKIFKLRGSQGSEYSGNVDDYVVTIKDEDFSDPKYIKRPPKVVKAEKDIEAAIKRFERSLKSQLDKEDYDKLKRYRLINNLITVKEMKSPDKLFKTPNEIRKDIPDEESNGEDSSEE